MNRLRIFISSVQKELAGERRAIRDFVRGDPLLTRFFDVFLFEDQPASDRRADEVYLDEVDRCDLYLGLFGNDYGYPDTNGLSPTEREFDRATGKGKTRLIYVKGADDKNRQPKMTALIRKAGDQLIRRRFTTKPEVISAVYASLTDCLEQRGIIQDCPFDERPCRDAVVDGLDTAAVKLFVRLARSKRDFPLAEDTPMEEVLTHLALLRDGKPTNAAVLLFGKTPQRFVPCAEVRCMHFHGTEIERPAPFYRIFKGPLFAQVDEAANFVLSVTNVSVGTRSLGPQAPVRLEIPRDVIHEAIVNAVVHRDYTSGAAVQVAVFADRVEIWNPGELLPPLTPDSLRVPHRSIARNHRICESMFLAGYIEKYGTGTLMMIRESVEHALPEPIFRQSVGEFVSVVGRDWLTEEVITGMGLNERQRKAVVHVKVHGQITNAAYRSLAGMIRKTATRDLEELVAKGVLRQVGATGRGTHYVMARKRDMNGTNGTQARPMVKRDINRTNGTSTARGIDSATDQTTHTQRRATRHKPVKPVMHGDSEGTSKTVSSKHAGKIETSQVMRKGLAGSEQVTKPVETKSTPNRRLEVHDGVHDGVHEPFSWTERRILEACGLSPRSTPELLAELGYAVRTRNFRNGLKHLLSLRFLELGIPGKPRSKKQQYRLTEKGQAWLRKVRP